MLHKVRRWWTAARPTPGAQPARLVAEGSNRSATTPSTTSPTPSLDEQSQRGERQRDREFIVIGLGRFGTSLAKALVKDGHDVLAVDADYTRVQSLAMELPHVVQIDATNDDAVREIGADHFDTGIVCIGTDFESNLLATVLLRRIGVRRIIAKARTRTQKEILLQVGVNEVILPEHEAGRRLAQRLSAVNVVDYLQLSPELSVVEMHVPAHLAGQTLAEADFRRRYRLTVLAIRREGHFTFNPVAETQLMVGDEILVVGNIADAQRLNQ